MVDGPAIEAVRQLRGGWRTVFTLTSGLGHSSWVLSTTILVGAILLSVRPGAFDRLITARLSRVYMYCTFVLASVALSGIAANLLKIGFGRVRPRLYEMTGVYGFDFFTFGQPFTSFPSGHSTTVAAVGAAFALIFPRHWWAGLVFALVGGASRVFVGAHYPSDVIFGLFLGAFFSYAIAHQMAERGLGFQFTPGGLVVPDRIGQTLVGPRESNPYGRR
jgi:undecaprenyl-diphosphatase